MSTDERTLSERVASMITNAVSADAFYFRELDAVVALLREQQAEIERLTASVLALHAKRSQDVDERNAEIDSLRRDLEAARVDASRLLWVFIDTGIDQIGDIDIHARACEINDGEDEMKDASYLQAIREAVDLARASGEG
jgi:hypothetical protein